MKQPQPVILEGKHVRLEPMRMQHIDALHSAAGYPELWRYSLLPMETREQLGEYMRQALAEQLEGRALPFVQWDLASGEVAGSTRYGNIDVYNRKLEIGWTWLSPRFQRSALNSEAKLLLLTHAFEELSALRVEFKGDALNMQSRNALERIGAVYEGTLRSHMRTAGDRQRDSFYFSIIAEEWPDKKAALQAKLR